MNKRNRIRIEIDPDNHTKALLQLDGYEIELPLVSWGVNGGLSLNIPWEWVDLVLKRHEPEPHPRNS